MSQSSSTRNQLVNPLHSTIVVIISRCKCRRIPAMSPLTYPHVLIQPCLLGKASTCCCKWCLHIYILIIYYFYYLEFALQFLFIHIHPTHSSVLVISYSSNTNCLHFMSYTYIRAYIHTLARAPTYTHIHAHICTHIHTARMRMAGYIVPALIVSNSQDQVQIWGLREFSKVFNY